MHIFAAIYDIMYEPHIYIIVKILSYFFFEKLDFSNCLEKIVTRKVSKGRRSLESDCTERRIFRIPQNFHKNSQKVHKNFENCNF